MTDLAHAARLVGHALTRPVEFYDRVAGRRERAGQTRPLQLEAETADPVGLAHRLAGSDGVGCCAELPTVRGAVLGRLTGTHHHDGGTSLADMLWVLVRHREPTVVVETGVARGISSAFILDAMQRNGHGHLWSIDLPPMTAGWGDQTGIAVAPEVRHRWTYVRGAARRRLPTVLATCGAVDMFVHDGLHTTGNVLFELGSVWPRLAPGGLLIADDADHNHAVLTFAETTSVAPVLLREPDKHGVVAVFTGPDG